MGVLPGRLSFPQGTLSSSQCSTLRCELASVGETALLLEDLDADGQRGIWVIGEISS